MRFKVPQNIDMPDRILGPLTMLQFIEGVLGGGLAYLLYVSMGGFLGTTLAIIIALFTVAVIFLKINERPFLQFLLSFIQFSLNPKQRVWEKGENGNLKIEIYHSSKKNSLHQTTQKHINKQEIENLAKKLDSDNKILIKR